jgi:hypothetical protein
MQKLSVHEFAVYCAGRNLKQISFWTENQLAYSVANPCKLQLSFNKISVHENPNVIYLQGSGNTLYFDRVKRIEIDTKQTVLGTVFTVFCGDKGTDGQPYVLVAV